MDSYDKNLQKLNRLLSLMDEDTLTKEDFVAAFENVVNYVKSIQAGNAKELDLIRKNLDLAADNLKDSVTSDFAGLKNSLSAAVARQFAKLETSVSSKLAELDEKMASVRDGKDADEDTIVDRVLSRIPKQDLNEIYNELTDFIKEQLAEMKKSIKAIPERPTTTIFGPGKTKIVKLDLSSQLNGVLKTFYVGTHFGIISVQSSSSPFGAFREGVDYNEVGKNIVFTSEINAAISLASGQSLIVKYLK